MKYPKQIKSGKEIFKFDSAHSKQNNALRREKTIQWNGNKVRWKYIDNMYVVFKGKKRKRIRRGV